MKRILVPALVSALILSACGSSQSASSSSSDAQSISGFDKYTWGMSDEDIKKSDSNLHEIDTGIDGLTALTGDGSIYNIPATVTYCFGSDGLETIAYETTASMSDDDYEKLCDSFIDLYGQASVSKDSTGWGKCSLWTDSDKDYAYVSQMDEIVISEHDSKYTDNAAETLNEFHEINLKSELG